MIKHRKGLIWIKENFLWRRREMKLFVVAYGNLEIADKLSEYHDNDRGFF
jgi:hypothetical protein